MLVVTVLVIRVLPLLLVLDGEVDIEVGGDVDSGADVDGGIVVYADVDVTVAAHGDGVGDGDCDVAVGWYVCCGVGVYVVRCVAVYVGCIATCMCGVGVDGCGDVYGEADFHIAGGVDAVVCVYGGVDTNDYVDVCVY